MSDKRLQDLVTLYSLLDELGKKAGGARTLAGRRGRMQWPARGVYFFHETGENREENEMAESGLYVEITASELLLLPVSSRRARDHCESGSLASCSVKCPQTNKQGERLGSHAPERRMVHSLPALWPHQAILP